MQERGLRKRALVRAGGYWKFTQGTLYTCEIVKEQIQIIYKNKEK